MLLVFITACGGEAFKEDTNDSNSTLLMTEQTGEEGSDNCVMIPYYDDVTYSQTDRYPTTGTVTNTIIQYSRTKDSTTNDKVHMNIEISSNKSPTIRVAVEIEQFYTTTRDGRYRDVTKRLEVSTTNQGITAHSETNFSPSLREFREKLCQGQSYTTTYIETIKSNIAPITTSSHTLARTVESIHESKIVPAGTFVTVRIKNMDTKLTWITWKDIKTGITVAREGPTHAMELLSYNVGKN